ncbi:MAG: LysM peptidoglycan-binding domain-containing protein, partial [Verrucomicrobiae bacterium]|nr:LysM peptidoglycan-binding domain-containing protein [Verrucomicrobiae bacterium]
PAASAASAGASKPKPSAAAAAAKSRRYTVQRGEGIQMIAEKVYGDRSRWREIMQANPSIKDPARLRAGQVLVIPP